LVATAISLAAALAVLNKLIIILSTYKRSLNKCGGEMSHTFHWKHGDIFYTVHGRGKPLLLLHDLNPSSGSHEWNKVVDSLSANHTVYSLDLLGCGRSEKPHLSYTNFLYVQLLTDFIHTVIGRKPHLICTGTSVPLAVIASKYCPGLFENMVFVNPLPCTDASRHLFAKAYNLPLKGTFLYHLAFTRNKIKASFARQYFYNPRYIRPVDIDNYHESAHLGDSPKSLYASILDGLTWFSITEPLSHLEQKILIIGGAGVPDIKSTLASYRGLNPRIETAIIDKTKYLPHMEAPAKFTAIAEKFLV
jgi:pimeloyl-ACP methyl ester carboxylesterase